MAHAAPLLSREAVAPVTGTTVCPLCGLVVKRRGLGAHKGATTCRQRAADRRARRAQENREAKERERLASLERRGFVRVRESDRPIPRDIEQVALVRATGAANTKGGLGVTEHYAPRHDLLAVYLWRTWTKLGKEGRARYPGLVDLGERNRGRLYRVMRNRLRDDRSYRAQLLAIVDMPNDAPATWVHLALVFLDETLWGVGR